MSKRSKIASLYSEKLSFHCKFCDFPISNPGFFPGKKLMINRYCPHCFSLNSFPFLSAPDRKFLRVGFFSNPLYPLFPRPNKGMGASFSLTLYPLEVILNFSLNILYMPLGLIINNITIAKSNKVFYKGYAEKNPEVIYLDMLRQKSAQGNTYCSLMLGKFYLSGELVPQDESIALDYFKACKNEREEEIVQVVKKLLNKDKPPYPLMLELLNLVKENEQALYYLAYFYYFGYGVAPSLKTARDYAIIARSVNIKDSLDIYRKLELN